MKCKKCGVELKGSWMFCPDCGERLEDEFSILDTPTIEDIMAESDSNIKVEEPKIEVTDYENVSEEAKIPDPVYDVPNPEPAPLASHEEKVQTKEQSYVDVEFEDSPRRVIPKEMPKEAAPIEQRGATLNRSSSQATRKEVVPNEAQVSGSSAGVFIFISIVCFAIAIVCGLTCFIRLCMSEGENYLSGAVGWTIALSIFTILSSIVAISFKRKRMNSIKPQVLLSILAVLLMSFSIFVAVGYHTYGENEQKIYLPVYNAGNLKEYYEFTDVTNMIQTTVYYDSSDHGEFVISGDFDILVLVDANDDSLFTSDYNNKLRYLNSYAKNTEIYYGIVTSEYSYYTQIRSEDIQYHFYGNPLSYVVKRTFDGYEIIPLSYRFEQISAFIQ